MMDVQSEKFKLIEWLVGLSDITTLKKVAEVRNLSIKNESILQPISLEELKTRALESEEAIKQGNVTSFEDLQNEMKAW